MRFNAKPTSLGAHRSTPLPRGRGPAQLTRSSREALWAGRGTVGSCTAKATLREGSAVARNLAQNTLGQVSAAMHATY
jgi:hypothetical protein